MKTITLTVITAAFALAVPAGGQTSNELTRHGKPAPARMAKLELFASIGGPSPIGIVVAPSGRVFMSFSRAIDKGPYCVAEIIGGKPVPYPSAAINTVGGAPQSARLVSVQGLTVDKNNTLWLLDSGVVGTSPTQLGGPKLVGVDLATNKVTRMILFSRKVAGPNAYLNDVRVSREIGTAGTAFITDSSEKGPTGIVVVDLATGQARRRLNNHPSTKAEPGFIGVVEGQAVIKRPKMGAAQRDKTGADGLAISGDGKTLFYCPNEGLQLYGVSTAALADASKADLDVAATVQEFGAKPGPSDGIECDAAGHVYVTDWEHNAVQRYTPGGSFTTVAHGPGLLWPDSLAIDNNGYLYMTATQLNRQAKYHKGKDLRRKPIGVYRVKLDAQPVMR